MKTLIAFYIILITMVSCNNLAQSSTVINKIKKVEYASALPYYDLRINKQVSNVDTVKCYFIDSFVILHRYVLHGNFQEEIINEDTSNSVLTSEEYLSNFFLYKKNSRYGFFSDSTGNEKKLLVDSFLRMNIMHYEFPRNYKDICILVSMTKTKGRLHENYASINDNPVNFKKDSMFLVFDKSYQDIDFSISPFLDSLYNSKLCELTLIVDNYYDSARNTPIPRQEIYMRVEKKEVNLAENAFIYKLLEKYKTASLFKQ